MKRVLFVDDDPLILSGLRRMLRDQRQEWEMLFANSGDEALHMLAENACDIVVSDMRMPQMDGAELLQRVRTLYPAAVRIVLSGQSDKEAILRCVGPAHQFLSKPCVPERLRETIQRASAVADLVQSAPLRTLISRIDNLPAIPKLYERLLSALQSPDVSLEEIAGLIAADVSMTTKLMQLVNSSFFGLPQRITNPAHAVSLLGLNLIQALTLSAGVFFHRGIRPLFGFSLERIVAHSLQVATSARLIAGEACHDPQTVEDAFLAGMLHDVGKVVLASCLPAEYEQVLRRVAADNVSLPQAEQDAWGADHAAVGAFLVELWGLPATIVEAVAFHHRPSDRVADKFTPLSAVHLANGLQHQPADKALDVAYLAPLGITPSSPMWQRFARPVCV